MIKGIRMVILGQYNKAPLNRSVNELDPLLRTTWCSHLVFLYFQLLVLDETLKKYEWDIFKNAREMKLLQ